MIAPALEGIVPNGCGIVAFWKWFVDCVPFFRDFPGLTPRHMRES